MFSGLPLNADLRASSLEVSEVPTANTMFSRSSRWPAPSTSQELRVRARGLEVDYYFESARLALEKQCVLAHGCLSALQERCHERRGRWLHSRRHARRI